MLTLISCYPTWLESATLSVPALIFFYTFQLHLMSHHISPSSTAAVKHPPRAASLHVQQFADQPE